MIRVRIQPELAVQVIVEQDGNGYYAHSPALPGLHIDGETIEDALYRARAAATLYIESLIAEVTR